MKCWKIYTVYIFKRKESAGKYILFIFLKGKESAGNYIYGLYI